MHSVRKILRTIVIYFLLIYFDLMRHSSLGLFLYTFCMRSGFERDQLSQFLLRFQAPVSSLLCIIFMRQRPEEVLQLLIFVLIGYSDWWEPRWNNILLKYCILENNSNLIHYSFFVNSSSCVIFEFANSCALHECLSCWVQWPFVDSGSQSITPI